LILEVLSANLEGVLLGLVMAFAWSSFMALEWLARVCSSGMVNLLLLTPAILKSDLARPKKLVLWYWKKQGTCQPGLVLV
jgi:hypothetical protein